MRKTFIAFLTGATLLGSSAAYAGMPITKNGVTTINLEQHGGYFSTKETLADLRPGKYRFVVANKTDKMVGFQIQDYVSHQVLDMFPLEPGQTRSSEVAITSNGFRFRCPINPTPWYDVENVRAK